MKHIFKQDNEKMSVGKRTITLYDNITEVQTDDGIQYECDMHTVKNAGVFDYDTLLAQEKSRLVAIEKAEMKEDALKLLAATDYKIIKAMEQLLVAQGLVESREELRDTIREAM